MVQEERDYFHANGNDFILRQRGGGSARLLVRLLEGSTPYESVDVDSFTGQDLTLPSHEALLIRARAASARFHVLLWPLEDEEAPLPATSWDEAEAVLRIGDDELKLSVELITTSHSTSRGIATLNMQYSSRRTRFFYSQSVYRVFWMVVFEG